MARDFDNISHIIMFLCIDNVRVDKRRIDNSILAVTSGGRGEPFSLKVVTGRKIYIQYTIYTYINRPPAMLLPQVPQPPPSASKDSSLLYYI